MFLPGLLLRAARSALHILGGGSGVCHNIFNVNKCQYASDDERKKIITKRLQHGTGRNLAQRTAIEEERAGGISWHSPPRNFGSWLFEQNMSYRKVTG